MKTEKFDVEKAKAGQEVVTGNGEKVNILFYDLHGCYKLIAIVTDQDGCSMSSTYTNRGCLFSSNPDPIRDLHLVKKESKKATGWINIYSNKENPKSISIGNILFETKENAKRVINQGLSVGCIGTVKIKFKKQ